MDVEKELKIDSVVYRNFLLSERLDRALELRNQYISRVKIKRRCNIYNLLNLKSDYSNEKCIEIINDFILNGLKEFAENLIEIEYYCMNSYGVKQDISFRLRGVLALKSKDILSLFGYKSKHLSRVNKGYIDRAYRVHITNRSVLRDKLLNFIHLNELVEIVNRCIVIALKWISFIEKEFLMQYESKKLISLFEQFIDLARYNLRGYELDIVIITDCVEKLESPFKEIMCERFFKCKSLEVIEVEMFYTYEYIASTLTIAINKLLPLYQEAKTEYILGFNQR